MKYPTPKLFKPTAEDMKRIAEELANHFPDSKVISTQDGQRVRGKRKSS